MLQDYGHTIQQQRHWAKAAAAGIPSEQQAALVISVFDKLFPLSEE